MNRAAGFPHHELVFVGGDVIAAYLGVAVAVALNVGSRLRGFCFWFSRLLSVAIIDRGNIGSLLRLLFICTIRVI